MPDNLNIYGQIYPDAAGIKAKDTNGNTLTFYRPQGTKSITENGQGIDVASYASVNVNVPSSSGTYQQKTVNPTEQQQAITPDTGYDALSQVTVNGISNTYVGSGINRRSSSDLTTSGATVSVPSGYYESNASGTIQSGTEGTPIATKGTVSNHSVTVTPSVTNTAGYIAGGTKNGTGVNVTASELVSGTKSIIENDTGIDVTNYASVDVSVPNTYESTDEGKVVSNGALIAQSSDTVTSNGTVNTTLINSLSVNVPQDTFVVTLLWDDDYFGQDDGAWVPDATYTDISAAYAAGKIIVAISDTNYITQDIQTSCGWNSMFNMFEYYLVQYNASGGNTQEIWYSYVLNSSGTISKRRENTYYDTQSADATSSDVLSGKIFFDGSGSHTGSIQTKTASDLTASGATVTVPAGYYENSATKTITSGTEGTPTATKGTVSNHSVTVTPSVTNTAGYISGGTHTGTGVTVQASELVSGTYSVDSSGTKDITNYASVSVPSGTAGTPSAAKGTVSNNSITVTPSVTNVTGYITGGTKTGTGVTVSASELVSGTYTVNSSGTKDVTNYASVSISAGTAGTPSATKGTVSNHSISVTPSVTNTTGWITGSTKSGTAVTVSASELVSGSETKTSNGTYDVTNLASLQVAIPIVTYYTGSSAPSSSLGQNGDIYLQT